MPTKTNARPARPVDDRRMYTRTYLQEFCGVSYEELCDMRNSGIVKRYGRGRQKRYAGKEINAYWLSNPSE